MNAFQTRCNSARTFRRLRSLTLTLPTKTLMSHWIHDVEELLKLAPLEFLQLNSTESLKYSPIVTDLWRIITTHRSRLRCFSLHRVQMSLPALHLICSQCPVLEQLFVAVEQQELVSSITSFTFRGFKSSVGSCRPIVFFSQKPSYVTYQHRFYGE